MSETNYTFSDDRGEKLEHYGVLGMKWGVRKDRGSSGRSGKIPAEAIAASGKRGAKYFRKSGRAFEKAIAKKHVGDTKGYEKYKVKAGTYLKKGALAAANHQAKIDVARKNLDETTAKQLDNPSRMAALNTVAAAEKYLKTAKDPTYTKFNTHRNISAIGGLVGAGIYRATPKGRAEAEAVTKRINEVSYRSMLRVQSERKYGKEKVDAMFEREFGNRKDVY